MSKIKLTKGELKKQRDSLKQFQHYLPTLQLKKQQLQMKILEARRNIEEQEAALRGMESKMAAWLGLFADPLIADGKFGVDFKHWMTPGKVLTDRVNIAGAGIPVFKDIVFPDIEFDLYLAPFWIDQAIPELRKYTVALSQIAVLREQIRILEYELRITTQRVNLFEKVKIPECKNNIRVIRIYLGDQQANAVGVSKVAKRKVEMRELAEAGACTYFPQ